MTFLAFAYSLVLIAGLFTELNWRAPRWMPLVAPLNTMMAAVWVVVLLGLSSPLFNTWSISAASQERLLTSGKADPEKFDFGYLRFRLGAYGSAALGRLEAAENHPQAAKIRAGIARARDAQSYWEYQHPEVLAPAVETPPDSGAPAQPGPLDLELNPEGAPQDDSET